MKLVDILADRKGVQAKLYAEFGIEVPGSAEIPNESIPLPWWVGEYLEAFDRYLYGDDDALKDMARIRNSHAGYAASDPPRPPTQPWQVLGRAWGVRAA